MQLSLAGFSLRHKLLNHRRDPSGVGVVNRVGSSLYFNPPRIRYHLGHHRRQSGPDDRIAAASNKEYRGFYPVQIGNALVVKLITQKPPCPVRTSPQIRL